MAIRLVQFVGAQAAQGPRYDAGTAIEGGTLPCVALAEADAPAILAAYVNTHLKEEIREGGLVRRVPSVVRFLGVAGLLAALRAGEVV